MTRRKKAGASPKRLGFVILIAAIIISGLVVFILVTKKRFISNIEGIDTPHELIEYGMEIYNANNPEPALSIWRAVARDESVDPFYRAMAVNCAVQKYLALSTKKTRTQIFTGDPVWEEFLSDAEKKLQNKSHNEEDIIELAAKNAFQYSYDLHPTAVAGLRIAQWYTKQLRDSQSLQDAVRQEYVTHIKSLLSEASEIKGDVPLAEFQRFYLLDGIVSGLGVFKETGEKAYKERALSSVEKAMTFRPESRIGVAAAFRFAALLYVLSGEKERPRIEKLLNQVIESHAYFESLPREGRGVYTLLRKEIDHPAYHYHRAEIIELANFHQPFRNFLVQEIGWGENFFH